MSASPTTSVVLIGMPGAGKSTLGVMLAKALALTFLDTDILLQTRIGCTLQEYIDRHGYLELRREEEQVLLRNDFSNSVVATGGSVVYSDAGMQALAGFGPLVYLAIGYETLVMRVHNQAQRGIACPPGTTLKSLFQERKRLYQHYADIEICLDDLTLEEGLEQVKNKVVSALHKG